MKIKLLFLAIVFIFTCCLTLSKADAQNLTRLCVTTNGSNCIEIKSTYPLPIDCITGCSGSGGSTVTISGGTLTSITNPVLISASTAIPVSLSGTVTITSDTIKAQQSGTWIVQPGNTANTIPWLVTISPSTLPVSIAGTITITSDTIKAQQQGTWNIGTVTSITNPVTITASTAVPISGSVTVTATNLSTNIAQIGGTTIVNGGVAGSQSIGGTVATNVAITANPINLGAQGVSSENSAVTTARQVQLVADLVGKLIVLPYANPENFLNGQIISAMTVTTSTAVTGMGAQGGSLRVYVTQCTISNTHATVGTMVNLQDGSGGTVLAQIPAAAVYGGGVVPFPTPIKTTANTALFAVNVTTGASTFVSCTGYKGL